MYSNQKSRAKDKYSKQSRTGGGPQETLTSSEEVILAHLQKSRTAELCGLNNGIDSLAEPSEFTPAEACGVSEDCEDMQCTAEPRSSLDASISEEKVVQSTSSFTGSGKRKLEKKENCIYSLEEKRLKLEIQLLSNRIQQEEEIFNLRKALLNTYIRKATDEPNFF